MVKFFMIRFLVAVFIPLANFPDTKANDWGHARIDTVESCYHVELENQHIRVIYGRSQDGKDKMLEFYCKRDQRDMGEFDSRHHPRDPFFHTMKSAEITHDDAYRKTIRLDFGTRVQDVTIYNDQLFLEIHYHTLNDYGHTYDRGGLGGSYVIYGAQDWLRRRQSLEKTTFDPSTKANMNQKYLYPLYENSFFRQEWADPASLSYKGWMILGVQQGEEKGYGILLPAAKVKWLKLMGSSGGFERAINAPYRAYYFPVLKGEATQIILQGKLIVDTFIQRHFDE